MAAETATAAALNFMVSTELDQRVGGMQRLRPRAHSASQFRIKARQEDKLQKVPIDANAKAQGVA